MAGRSLLRPRAHHVQLVPPTPTCSRWILIPCSSKFSNGALNRSSSRPPAKPWHRLRGPTLGRGPDGWYFDEAEVDFWQVWTPPWAASTGPDRTVLSGYSMGGWGGRTSSAWRILTSSPEPSSYGGATGLRHPLALSVGHPGRSHDGYGPSAPLHVLLAAMQIAKARATSSVPAGPDRCVLGGYRYRYEQFPTQDHLAWATEDTFDTCRVKHGQPVPSARSGRITYTWFPDLSRADLGIGPTGVYWIRGIRCVTRRQASWPRSMRTSKCVSDPAVMPVRSACSSRPTRRRWSAPSNSCCGNWATAAHSEIHAKLNDAVAQPPLGDQPEDLQPDLRSAHRRRARPAPPGLRRRRAGAHPRVDDNCVGNRHQSDSFRIPQPCSPQPTAKAWPTTARLLPRAIRGLVADPASGPPLPELRV